MRQVKLYSDDEDTFIYKNFDTMTHKEMGKALGRSTESIRSRCRTLNLKKPVYITVVPVKTGCIQPEGLDISELPAKLQKWFGLAPGFKAPLASKDKPYIRHIEETMPNIPTSKAKIHIGCGTQFMIGELANL